MNCILCDDVILGERNFCEIYYTYTTYSNTLFINFIKKIVNLDLNDPRQRHLCKQCHSIFDELDLAETNCLRIKRQIYERLTTDSYGSFLKDASVQTDSSADDSSRQDKFEDSSSTTTTVMSAQAFEDIEKEIKVEKSEPANVKKAKPYECAVCQKRFASKSGMVLHAQRQHPPTQTETNGGTESTIKLECDVFIDEEAEDECKKAEPECETTPDASNKSKGGKRKQQTAETKIRPLKYACPQCPKMWRTTGELRSHVATHSSLRPYICEMCGQAYKHKSALDIHVGMHNGINPFSCHFCNKAFTQKGALQRHLPIHTGDAPYQCDLCGKRFVHHTSFNMHTLAHTGQKSYKCTLCGLALLSGSHLKRHMRVHTGERPYACSQCGKRFAERYNLVAHQRLHEAGPSTDVSRRLHKCQVCGAGFDRRPKLEEHLSNNHNKISESDQGRKWVGHFLSTM